MSTTRKIFNWIKRYPELEMFGKEGSYQLHTFIIEENNSLLSYFAALIIPISCTLSLVTKLLSDTCRAIHTIVESIRTREYAGGNIQTLLVDAAEYTRHIFGIIFGLPTALLWSPKTAADAFLTKPANPAKTFLNQKEGSRLYSMGDLLHKFFVTHNIDYRICSGTALGARRESGIIRNDDDIDLMLHPDSVEQFKTLVNNGTFEKETGINIRPQPWTGGWQSFCADSPKGEKGSPLEHIGKPFVDIFPGVWRNVANNNVITYGKDNMFYQSKGDYFTKEEWDEKPVLYPFGPTKLYGIKSIDGYIERSYGPLALNYITLLYPHDAYSKIYAKPLKTFSILSDYPTPRFLRHVQKAPLAHDKNDYVVNVSKWSHEEPEAKSLPLMQLS